MRAVTHHHPLGVATNTLDASFPHAPSHARRYGRAPIKRGKRSGAEGLTAALLLVLVGGVAALGPFALDWAFGQSPATSMPELQPAVTAPVLRPAPTPPPPPVRRAPAVPAAKPSADDPPQPPLVPPKLPEWFPQGTPKTRPGS